MKKKFLQNNKGFTMVEMLVAIFIFSIVVTIAAGAMFTLISANKNAQSLKSVMDNLNSALENMSRNIRYGSAYHCGTFGSLSSPQSCATGDKFFAYETKDGDPATSDDQVVYQYDAGSQAVIRCIGYDSSTCTRITAPEVHIQSFRFYVTGSDSVADNLQPLVLISLQGYAGNGNSQSTFAIETLVSQRNPDK